VNLSDLLDRPVAFHRAFVSLGLGVTGALMLSQAVYWSRRTSGGDGWFYKSQVEWEEETGLTRYEQEGARKMLIKMGILQEEKRGVPCRLHYRVDMASLRANLLGESQQSSLGNFPKQVCEFSPSKDGENRQAIKTEITTETTTEITTEHITGTLFERASGDETTGPKNPEAKTYETWKAYSEAYLGRYGNLPLWNKAVGGKLAQVVARVGKENAPLVAAFYLTINDAFYVRKLHPVGNLLADCESIYSQMVNGNRMTAARARQIDGTQSNFDAAQQAKAMLRKRATA
jgi:hypothetical protein